jgi:hypothetical protein
MACDRHAFGAAAARALRWFPRPRRTGLAGAVLLAALALPALPAHAGAAYQNPFAGDDYYVGRTDMGVDLCLTPGAPIRAVGDGVVVGIFRDWSERQPYIWYQLTSGPDAGRFIYVAEQIDQLARVGQTLQAGDVVARYARKGTCIETGWSAADGATLAQVTTGYQEGDVTAAGISFARFLIATGVEGQFELAAPKSQAAARHRHPAKRRRRH